MPSLEYELGYLQAGLEVLQDYLLSNEIYWTTGAKAPAGEPPYPQLTLGGLELAWRRARAMQPTGAQAARLDELEKQLAAARAGRRVAWGKKAAKEFHARLGLWRNFIEELRDHPGSNQDRYAYEVSRRVMLDYLAGEAESIPPAEQQLLAGMDKFLRAKFQPGEFVWEPALQKAFPSDKYWYLYGRPKPGGEE